MSILSSILLSWQSNLFLLAGVFRGLSTVPLFTDAWHFIQNNMKPFITILAVVFFHFIECCMRIPFLMTAKDKSTRYQPVVFTCLFALLLILYCVSYFNPKSKTTKNLENNDMNQNII